MTAAITTATACNNNDDDDSMIHDGSLKVEQVFDE
tara:strand:- start:312 stop:416 length:105 start_codon:yes stop_codon:yes gene_type:complete